MTNPEVRLFDEESFLDYWGDLHPMRKDLDAIYEKGVNTIKYLFALTRPPSESTGIAELQRAIRICDNVERTHEDVGERVGVIKTLLEKRISELYLTATAESTEKKQLGTREQDDMDDLARKFCKENNVNAGWVRLFVKFAALLSRRKEGKA